MVKKFLIKLISIALCVFICTLYLNHLYLGTNQYAESYGETEKFDSVPSNITFANFGNSHGMAAFIYGDEDGTAFNFSLSGETLINDYSKLMQYTPNLSKGCIVAITVTYISFCDDPDQATGKRYYTFLDKKYIKDFSWDILFNAKFIPVARSFEYLVWDRLGEGLFLRSSAAEAAPEETSAAQAGTAATSVDGAPLRAASWRAGSFNTGELYLAENREILVQMIEHCRENGFVPVLVTTPVSDKLNAEFTTEELNKFFYDNVKYVVEKENVPWCDLSQSEEFIHNYDLFGNCDHLNASGAAKFMEVFRRFVAENCG